MIYAVSDLHGCYEKYIQMLKIIHFNKEDTLYVLGDVVDRGPGGIRILQHMRKQGNILPLRGNHDVLAASLLKKLSDPANLRGRKLVELCGLWFEDGGRETYRAFTALSREEKTDLLKYMDSFFIYEEITVNGRNFFLSHTVPGKEKMLDFDSCRWEDFVMGEPDYEETYFEDRCLVTGHTPTGFIEESFAGRIWKKNRHIAIDCGAVFGNPLGCICLDTLEEFYAEGES